MAQIRVRDQFGNFPPPPCDRLFIQLIPDGGDGTPKTDRFTDDVGQTDFAGAWTVWPADGYTLHVNYANVNKHYGTAEVHVTREQLINEDIDIVVQKGGSSGGGSVDAGERLPLVMDGITIRASDGATWRYAGMTAFRLYARFLDGQDIEPILRDYITCGGLVEAGKGPNTLRVLLTASALFSLSAWETTRESLGSFLDVLARFGLRCEAVVLADANPDRSVYPNVPPTAETQQEQQAFLDLVAPELAEHWNALPDLGNECSHKINRVDRGAFARPAGSVLWSRGSGQADEPPFTPPWDICSDHPGRPDDWPRRLPARDIRSTDGPPWGIHHAAIENEPMGAGDVDQPGRRSANADDFAQFGAHAGMNSNGACFHFENGLQTTLLSAKQAELAAAFFLGLRFSPPDAQLWPYRRGGLTGPSAPLIRHSDRYNDAGVEVDTAGALRTFCKESPSGDGYSVAIRPGANWSAVPVDGRRIVESPRHGLIRTIR